MFWMTPPPRMKDFDAMDCGLLLVSLEWELGVG